MSADIPAQTGPTSAEPAGAVQRRQVFQGRVIHVGVETVRLPNGQTVDLEIIRHPGGAAAVALDAQGRVCLLRQYRHAGGGWLWELPAGKLDPDEDPFATARRELTEEAGVEAATWQPLGRMLSSPGVFTEVIHLYLGRDLTPGLLAHEGEEIIEIHWLPLDQALAWCLDGTILDAKTLIGLFRAAAVLGRQPVGIKAGIAAG
jgi:ADP-ribose pyrophosphatase